MADEVKRRWRCGGGHSPASGNFHHGPLLPGGWQLTSSATSVGWLVKTAQYGGKTLSPGPLSPVPTPRHRKWEPGFLKPLSLGWVQFRQIHDAPFLATMKFQQPVMRISEEHTGAEGGSSWIVTYAWQTLLLLNAISCLDMISLTEQTMGDWNYEPELLFHFWICVRAWLCGKIWNLKVNSRFLEMQGVAKT